MGCAAPHSMHWQALAARSDECILSHPGVTRHPSQAGFVRAFLGQEYHLDSQGRQVLSLAGPGDRPPTEAFAILLLGSLLAPPLPAPLGEWISEKQFPGGVTFFQGPHALPTKKLAGRFGRDPEGFAQRGRELGGEVFDAGDRAVALLPLANLRLGLVLWLADEEFEARVRVLFDRSLAGIWSLDLVYLLACEVCDRFLHEGGVP